MFENCLFLMKINGFSTFFRFFYIVEKYSTFYPLL